MARPHDTVTRIDREGPPPPPGELCLQSRPALGWAVAALLWVVAGLSLVSLARLWLARDRHAWLWTVFVFGPALVYMVTHFLVRYREPVHAIGLLLACRLVLNVAAAIGSGSAGRPPSRPGGPARERGPCPEPAPSRPPVRGPQ